MPIFNILGYTLTESFKKPDIWRQINKQTSSTFYMSSLECYSYVKTLFSYFTWKQKNSSGKGKKDLGKKDFQRSYVEYRRKKDFRRN